MSSYESGVNDAGSAFFLYRIPRSLYRSGDFAKDARVRTYPLHEARAEFSKLVERALGGEPQRVTRHGKEAVVIVSEAEWTKRPESAATLGDLLADFAERAGFDEDFFSEQIAEQKRPLGADFLGDDE